MKLPLPDRLRGLAGEPWPFEVNDPSFGAVNRAMHEAADELTNLTGRQEALARWIVDALKVLDTIDPDDTEESEALLTLIKTGEKLAFLVLEPEVLSEQRASTGPACNLLRPWEAP